MISREEAKSILKEDAEHRCLTSDAHGLHEDTEITLDTIYDSIGSCGECKHSVPISNYIRNSIVCECNGDEVDKDFFCAGFERKEPCGT